MTNGNKIKTAVCLSGHLRKYKDNIAALRAHLLSNPNLDCDVFLHTWRSLDRDGGPVVDSEVIAAYNPKRLIIDGNRKFSITPLMNKMNFNLRDINGLLSMFFKIKACNDLKASYERENGFTYDCVIRLRPDIQLAGDVPINLSTDLNKLYIPKHGDYTGLNDQFAFSNSKNMDIYSSTYDHINRYLQNGMFVNPENFTMQTIKESKLVLERPEVPYNIVWYNGHVWNNHTRHR